MLYIIILLFHISQFPFIFRCGGLQSSAARAFDSKNLFLFISSSSLYSFRLSSCARLSFFRARRYSYIQRALCSVYIICLPFALSPKIYIRDISSTLQSCESNVFIGHIFDIWESVYMHFCIYTALLCVCEATRAWSIVISYIYNRVFFCYTLFKMSKLLLFNLRVYICTLLFFLSLC